MGNREGKEGESVKSGKVKGGKVGDPARREGIEDRLWVIGREKRLNQ